MPSDARLSRRALLTAASAFLARTAAQTGVAIAPEFKRYADATTENPVTRLTDPAHTSLLPAWHLNAATRRGHSLVYSNDRTGQMQVYRMDLKSGESHQITDGGAVDPMAVALLPDDRYFACLAGRSLEIHSLRPGRPREVYRTPDDFAPTGGLAVSTDGAFAFVIEKGTAGWRLQKVPLARNGNPTTIVESTTELRDPMARPGTSEEILYRQGPHELRIAPGGRTLTSATGPVLWSPDGASILHLSIPDDPSEPNTIRLFDLATGSDTLVARTSRFVSFGRNGDASVFVGASGSKASPNVLLLLRSVRRELTLCEHRASNPALVMPRFTPNSQTVLFTSDKHGKTAIYAFDVARLVEATGD